MSETSRPPIQAGPRGAARSARVQGAFAGLALGLFLITLGQPWLTVVRVDSAGLRWVDEVLGSQLAGLGTGSVLVALAAILVSWVVRLAWVRLACLLVALVATVGATVSALRVWTYGPSEALSVIATPWPWIALVLVVVAFGLLLRGVIGTVHTARVRSAMQVPEPIPLSNQHDAIPDAEDLRRQIAHLWQEQDEA